MACKPARPCASRRRRMRIKSIPWTGLTYNSKRWITRLVRRWRAQPAAWINVNCRTHWTSTSWTHIAVPGHSGTTPVSGSVMLAIAVFIACALAVVGWLRLSRVPLVLPGLVQSDRRSPTLNWFYRVHEFSAMAGPSARGSGRGPRRAIWRPSATGLL